MKVKELKEVLNKLDDEEDIVVGYDTCMIADIASVMRIRYRYDEEDVVVLSPHYDDEIIECEVKDIIWDDVDDAQEGFGEPEPDWESE